MQYRHLATMYLVWSVVANHYEDDTGKTTQRYNKVGYEKIPLAKVDCNESDSPPIFELARLAPSKEITTCFIHLIAERASGSKSETAVTFPVYLQGFNPFNAQKPLWISDKCDLSSLKPFLPLLLEITSQRGDYEVGAKQR
ncbi:hypothetical protein TanjilG_30340 [Lupinus angustifolius]|nr:hypothetical protein TanjilG_30340 [Lupinus angustifolius]